MWKDFLSLIYPKICLGCETILVSNENLICLSCFADLPKSNFYAQSSILIGLEEYNFIIGLYKFNDDLIQQLIHALKYNGKSSVGVVLGIELGKLILRNDKYEEIDLIVPVPIHRNKKRKRGYNQSYYIAKGVAKIINAPIREILRKSEKGKSQTSQKKYERWLNVKDSFSLKSNINPQVNHVLIIDDVITTGATIEACVKAIRKYGKVKISIAVLAIA